MIFDDVAYGEQILCSEAMQHEMLRRADVGKLYAEAVAPVDETGPHPSQYKDAFTTSSGIQDHKTRRAYGRLENPTPEAIFVEKGNGTVKYQGEHVLSRAGDIMAGA